MRTRRGIAAVITLVVAAALSAGPPTRLAAAEPSPAASPSPEPPAERAPIQVWLDRPIATDPTPGEDLEVGGTLWDPSTASVADMGATIFMRAVPATAAGSASQATAISDWPGHYRGTVEVPPGGVDRLEMGITGNVCENDVCGPSDWVFELAGVGPPPDAPIISLAEARIDLAEPTLTAGQPVEITVILEPRGDWESLELPEEVFVRAREARGPNLAAASLPLVDAERRAYAGTLTIPEAGDLVLEVATDEDGGDETRFGTSMIRVAVEAGSGGGGAAAGAPEAQGGVGALGEEGIPPVLIALLAVVAIGAVGVMLLGFRGGGR